jgi:uncharacterized RDD family membrane protein YckC
VEEIKEKWICGFWRRIGALVIDTILLGVFGYIAGLFFEDTFVQIGPWGKLIGFVVSISYFGIMNSVLFNGQTFGKRILQIKVVDAANTSISLPRSFLRYSFLAIPFSLNGAQFTDEVLFSHLMYPFAFIVFGGVLSIAYLYIFNGQTRQSLHDLVVGTYVVNAGASAEKLPSVWKPHLVIVAGLFVFATLLPVFTSHLAESEPFQSLQATRKAISDFESIKYAGVSEGTTTSSSTNSATMHTSFISAEAYLYANNVEDSDIAEQLAITILKTNPASRDKDIIQVTLIYGYDIGIASKWNSYVHQFYPQELLGLE